MADMMAIKVGRLGLSRVAYIPDLQRIPTATIPIGVFAEIAVGGVRALGLIARTRLHDNELNMIGRLLRPRFANPFGFLEEQFNWAFEEAPHGEALTHLARRFSESLFSNRRARRLSGKSFPEGLRLRKQF